MAFLNPTTNAYRRITPRRSCRPAATGATTTASCSPAYRPSEAAPAGSSCGSATASANPYLASAATLFAGLDGIRRALDPPEPLAGLIYDLPDEHLGGPLPTTLDEALAALEGDSMLAEAMGEQLTTTFLENKRFELDRARKAVTDWEFEEYALAL